MRLVGTSGGRELAAEAFGDPEGRRVFLLHGTPGSRLGIGRLAVASRSGGSGGGPHAPACAALLPERVTGVLTAPYSPGSVALASRSATVRSCLMSSGGSWTSKSTPIMAM
ncbi:MAG: hypothetical protein QOF84_7393 [Streptomyces sp.]|nr:hypothetical protein [Streptomyces sp.]